jgi:hypothetical protein
MSTSISVTCYLCRGYEYIYICYLLPVPRTWVHLYLLPATCCRGHEYIYICYLLPVPRTWGHLYMLPVTCAEDMSTSISVTCAEDMRTSLVFRFVLFCFVFYLFCFPYLFVWYRRGLIVYKQRQRPSDSNNKLKTKTKYHTVRLIQKQNTILFD